MFNEIISREDQYEVAKARAAVARLAQHLILLTDTVCDIVLSKLDDIYEEEE